MALIYQATNLINGKRYIGRTERTLSMRKSQYKHGSIKGRGDSPIHRAMRKYGFDVFKFSVLLRCDDDMVRAEERRLIALIKPEYNFKSGDRDVRKQSQKQRTSQRPWMLPVDWCLPGEEWRQVVGFEGLYEVSNFGRARCLPGKDRGKEGEFGKRGKILKFQKNGFRAPASNLSKDGKRYRRSLHVLVLEAFVGIRPEGMLGCHRDDDGTNNRIDNLYWGTHKQNAEDSLRNGRRWLGERHPMSKLTEAQVREIHELRGMISQQAIANKFGIGCSTVADIHTGRYWKSVVTGVSDRKTAFIRKGGAHHNARLSENDVITIRGDDKLGVASSVLAKRYGVTYNQIRRIITRRTWRHI